ncbi:MAG: CRISPR-associated RAMP protein Csx10 [Cyanobacteria bacterium P01_H01_bin.121]
MQRISVTIEAQSPLAIGRRKPGGSISEAESYIPGSVLRGAIAAQILRAAQQAEPQLVGNPDLAANGGDFQTLFLADEAAIFQNAYPCLYKADEDYQVSATPIYVLPASAVSSKTNPGFKPKGYGVFDTLIDRFCAAACDHPYDPNCPEDNGRVEPFSGFYSCANNQANDITRLASQFRSHTAEKRLLTGVGINRRRSTSQDSVLYSLQVLSETHGKGNSSHAATYKTSILVQQADLAKQLTQLLNAWGPTLRLGGAASRGLGKIQLTATCQEDPTDLAQRVQTFNQALRDRWQQWSNLFSTPELASDRQFFTLDLQSEAILTEQWQRTTVISPASLQATVQLADASLRLEAAYSSYNYRSGWHSAWGLMKDVELVTQLGSVYLFSTTYLEQWRPKLERLEQTGIGDRTCEGFGQVRVCDPFHTIFREEAQ